MLFCAARRLTQGVTNTTTDATDYLWDYGDSITGTVAALTHTHTYTQAMPYTVTLTASGLGGSDTLTRTSYITAYRPVTAAFSAAPLSGVAP